MIVYLAAGDPKRLEHLIPRGIQHCLFTYWDRAQREKSIPAMARAKEEDPERELLDREAPARKRPGRYEHVPKLHKGGTR